jgi:hypothetical protein
MSNDELSRVFDMFGRAHSPGVENRQGAGLGLTISKRLVELHGGRMWVTSAKNRGSTFYVSLPLKKSLRPVAASLPAISNQTTKRFDQLTISTAAVAAAAPVTVAEPEMPTLTEESISDEKTIVSSTGQEIEEEDEMILAIAQAPPVAQEDAARIIRPEPRRRVEAGSIQPIQPVHRFQPKYIRRFGFILLGILGLLLVVVTVLAISNPLPREEETAGISTNLEAPTTAGTESSTATPDLPVVAAAPSETAPSVPAAVSAPNESPSVTATATPTLRPTRTPAPSLTSSPTLTFTPLPPTETVAPTATPVPPWPTAKSTQVPATTSPTPAETASAPLTGSGREDSASAVTTAPTAPPPPEIAFSGGEGGPAAVDSRVSWSDSGQALYADVEGGGRDIFVITAPGTSPVNLTHSAADDVQPAWSPDGRRIAFSSGRTGSFKIFIMDADGQNLVQLTDGWGFDEWPAWAPNGDRLAFVSDRDGNVEIYTINADGNNLQRRTDHPAEDWPVAWSPDGQWLVFSSNRDGDWNLYLLPVVGGEARQLTNSPGDERDPVWLSDGSIAFSHNGAGNWDIYTLWPNASQPVPASGWTRITNTLTDERFPAQQFP